MFLQVGSPVRDVGCPGEPLSNYLWRLEDNAARTATLRTSTARIKANTFLLLRVPWLTVEAITEALSAARASLADEEILIVAMPDAIGCLYFDSIQVADRRIGIRMLCHTLYREQRLAPQSAY
jgi:hypothetical protein